jgi:hypothetical protein
VLDDAIDRLRCLDDTLDTTAVMGALATGAAGTGDHRQPGDARRDPLVGALRDELVDVIIQPRRLTRAGKPSPAAERRAERAALCFGEGYQVGRIGLDTDLLPLRWSDPGHDVGLGTLRSLVLHPRLTDAYAGSCRLAPFLADLSEQTRGLPADQAAQFAGLGLLSAVAEWTAIVGRPAQRSELLLAVC